MQVPLVKHMEKRMSNEQVPWEKGQKIRVSTVNIDQFIGVVINWDDKWLTLMGREDWNDHDIKHIKRKFVIARSMIAVVRNAEDDE